MKPTKASKKISLSQANLLAAHLKNQPMTRRVTFPASAGKTPVDPKQTVTKVSGGVVKPSLKPGW